MGGARALSWAGRDLWPCQCFGFAPVPMKPLGEGEPGAHQANHSWKVWKGGRRCFQLWGVCVCGGEAQSPSQVG